MLGPEAGGWRAVLPGFKVNTLGLGTWRRQFLWRNGHETGARHGKRKDQKRIRKSSTRSRRERVRLALPARRGAFGQPAEYCGQGTGLRGGFVLQEGGAAFEAKYRTWPNMATRGCASEAADIPVAHPWRRNSASWLMAPQRADGAPLSLPGRRQGEPRGVSTVVYIATHAAQLGGWALQARCPPQSKQHSPETPRTARPGVYGPEIRPLRHATEGAGSL